MIKRPSAHIPSATGRSTTVSNPSNFGRPVLLSIPLDFIFSFLKERGGSEALSLAADFQRKASFWSFLLAPNPPGPPARQYTAKDPALLYSPGSGSCPALVPGSCPQLERPKPLLGDDPGL